MLGWIRTEGVDGVERDFYLRQLWDGKFSADIDAMSPSALDIYARLCGWTLARGHARSGDRVAIAAYLGSNDAFDKAMVDVQRRRTPTRTSATTTAVSAALAPSVRKLIRPLGLEVLVYFVGVGIFFFVAILCVFAYFGAKKQRRRYEETGSLEPDE